MSSRFERELQGCRTPSEQFDIAFRDFGGNPEFPDDKPSIFRATRELLYRPPSDPRSLGMGMPTQLRSGDPSNLRIRIRHFRME